MKRRWTHYLVAHLKARWFLVPLSGLIVFLRFYRDGPSLCLDHTLGDCSNFASSNSTCQMGTMIIPTRHLTETNQFRENALMRHLHAKHPRDLSTPRPSFHAKDVHFMRSAQDDRGQIGLDEQCTYSESLRHNVRPFARLVAISRTRNGPASRAVQRRRRERA
jgi:hypothetical protein